MTTRSEVQRKSIKSMTAIAATLALSFGGVGCDKTPKGGACKKTAQCAARHVCLAEICVEEGSTHLVDITLVGNDHDNLACAIDAPVAGLSCSHDAGQKRITDTAARDDPTRLQPMTTKNQLELLVANVWSQPAVKSKVDKGKPTSRFVANCTVRVRGSVEKARVQWKQGEPWQPATHVPVVVADKCTVDKR